MQSVFGVLEDDGDEWESEEEIGVDDEGKERKHRSVKRWNQKQIFSKLFIS